MTTTVLGAVCGFLVLTAILQYAGVGRGYRWAPDDPAGAPPLPGGAIDEKPLKFPPANAFASVEAHPLFNEDRKPTPIDASEAGGDASDAPQNPLNITLTGIVSTSSVKIAMVQDKARNQSVALKVGMPLEGDQASWTLVEVKPRSVVFRSAANERTEVELETSVAKLPAPPRSARPATPARPANARNDQRGSADLAKRIEERRKQMREDAEKLRNQGGKGKPPPKPVPPKH
ncbi:MAG TPA: type II secretion system protein N [Rhodanobacteraceae bacterium]|nr:type II secretion system protein N [Rhodanobacteraceae bacterium]